MSQASDKAQLRRQLRQLRQNIPATQRERAADTILTHLKAIPGWESCQHIAGYRAADGEVDPEKLLKTLCSEGRQTYLPVILPDNSLLFASWHPDNVLVANRFGIPEPTAEVPRLKACELNAILVPLVGWDREGRRLGMGGGFYDRSLEGFKGLKIGLAFARQEVDSLPCEDWDIGMDFVATESGLHDCRR